MKKLDAPLQIEFLRWRHALRGIEDIGQDAGEKSRIKNRSVECIRHLLGRRSEVG